MFYKSFLGGLCTDKPCIHVMDVPDILSLLCFPVQSVILYITAMINAMNIHHVSIDIARTK